MIPKFSTLATCLSQSWTNCNLLLRWMFQLSTPFHVIVNMMVIETYLFHCNVKCNVNEYL